MPPCIVKKSPIHGVGTFANKRFRKGQIVYLDQCCLPENVPGFNHSCNPNAKLTSDGAIVILKWIRKGQEITLDYIGWMVRPCNCQVCSKRKGK